MVDPSALRDTISQLVDTIMENRWDIESISLSDCAEQLPGVDLQMLRCALQALSADSEVCSGDGSTWNLDFRSISRSVASKLFAQRLADTGEVCADMI